MRKICLRLIILPVAVISFPWVLGAQTISPDTRLQQLQQFDSFFGPQSTLDSQQRQQEAHELEEWDDDGELGRQRILLRKPEQRPWKLFADTAVIYSSNAFLTHTSERGDAYAAGTVGASYNWIFEDSWNINLMARQQFFRYFEYSVLDFDHSALSARLNWVSPDYMGNIVFFGRWQWNRLTAARSNPSGISFGDEFLRYHTFTVGAQKLFFLNPYNYFFVGASSQFGLTERTRGSKQTDPQKDTYSLFAGYSYIYSRSLSTQIGYYLNRNVYDHIRTGNNKLRRDWNHSVSASAIWTFNDYLAAGAHLTYTWNESNERFFRYETANIGGNLELSYRF